MISKKRNGLGVKMNTTNYLKGKKVLFFMTYTFGYEKHISDAMISMGAQVDIYNEQPNNKFITKALIRVYKKIIAKKVNEYHNRIITATMNNHYDFIFFEKCESFERETIERIKQLHPESKFILYLWDSFKNNKNPLHVLDLFDKVFTFDKNDSLSYNIQLLPLFYIDSYSRIATHDNYKYKTLFIGTLHSDRFKIVSNITNVIKGYGYQCYNYFFLQSKILFYRMLLKDQTFRTVNKNDVNYNSLGTKDIFKLYEESEIIIDVQDPNQTGLTMRTLETLGARRKMITTNFDIVNYDFYDKNNICIVDRKKIVVPESFITGKYQPIPNDIYKKYSLTNWLNTIFRNN